MLGMKGSGECCTVKERDSWYYSMHQQTVLLSIQM